MVSIQNICFLMIMAMEKMSMRVAAAGGLGY
jgi:hypothetical protein